MKVLFVTWRPPGNPIIGSPREPKGLLEVIEGLGDGLGDGEGDGLGEGLIDGEGDIEGDIDGEMLLEGEALTDVEIGDTLGEKDAL